MIIKYNIFVISQKTKCCASKKAFAASEENWQELFW